MLAGVAAEDKAQKQRMTNMGTAGNALASGSGASGMAEAAAGSLGEVIGLTKAGTAALSQRPWQRMAQEQVSDGSSYLQILKRDAMPWPATIHQWPDSPVRHRSPAQHSVRRVIAFMICLPGSRHRGWQV